MPSEKESYSIITPGVNYQFGNGIKGDCVVVWIQTVKRGVDIDGTKAKNILDGLVAQNVTGQIQKQPRQFYEIGTEKYYFVESRPSGSGSIDHLVGPNNRDIWTSIKDFANVCKETNLFMGRKTDCTCKKVKGNSQVCFRSGLLNSVQVTATANDWVLTSRLGFSFYDLTDDQVTAGGSSNEASN